jgi:hypothetical protein
MRFIGDDDDVALLGELRSLRAFSGINLLDGGSPKKWLTPATVGAPSAQFPSRALAPRTTDKNDKCRDMHLRCPKSAQTPLGSTCQDKA